MKGATLLLLFSISDLCVVYCVICLHPLGVQVCLMCFNIILKSSFFCSTGGGGDPIVQILDKVPKVEK